jgi:hypothetical protein
MAKLAPFGPFRALDGEGDPLSGGKLYAYEAGTSTLKDTYTDASGDTANTNPVILDSEGYANVWLGSGAYKLVLKDSTDVTLWTIDDITGESENAFGSSVITQATNLNINAAHENAFINATAAITLSLLPAADAEEGFYFSAKANGGAVTIDPDGAELVDGASTITIPNGSSALIISNGTAWYSAFMPGSVNLSSGSLILPQATVPAQTAEGSAVWDTDNDLLTIGDGAGRKTMVDTSATQTITGLKTFTDTLSVAGTAANAGTLALYEDTDNGTNYVALFAPSSVASNRVQTLQDATGTVALTSNIPTPDATPLTYTPTLTNTTNVAASTASVTNYMRYGNMVFVWGQINITSSGTGTTTVLGFSLPIASALTQVYDVGGSFMAQVHSTSNVTWGGGISGDATNDRATFSGNLVNANIAYSFSFMYLVR